MIPYFMKKKIAIIGTGIGGLTAGYELLKKNNKVTIFEKEKNIGGLAAGFKMEGEILDKSYRHIFKTDKDIIELINELGLKNKLHWYKSSTGLYWQGKIYPFLTAMDLLKFKPLNILEKFRMGMVAMWLKFDKDWKKYENVLAYSWMKKMIGDKPYKVVWEPLLKGKFDDIYKQISMAWLWARIHTRGNSTNEKGEEVLGYLDGGFESLTKKLAEKIKTKGGKIILNKEIDDIEKIKKEFDLIIDTRPIKEVNYLGMVNIVFSSSQNLGKYYWNNINDLNSPFVALLQHTNLVGTKKYNGKNIYYLGTYISQKSKYFKWSDKQIIDEWLSYLPNVFPNFDRKQISQINVFKFKNAQHIVGLNYKVPAYKVSNNYYRLNFAQIYPQDRGMNYAVSEAKKMVDLLKT